MNSLQDAQQEVTECELRADNAMYARIDAEEAVGLAQIEEVAADDALTAAQLTLKNANRL